MRLFEVTEMPFSKALTVFGLTNDEFNKMDTASLKNRWRDMVKNSHPDLPQNKNRAVDIGNINAAYDSLKKYIGLNRDSYDEPRVRPENPYANRKTYDGVPPWQTDKRSSYNKISKNDFSDINYFKERIWEASKSKTEFTIWAFDGHFFRGVVTVYGNENPNVLRMMADGMIIWNGSGNPYETRAVFVTSSVYGSGKIALIYADKEYYVLKPIILEHDSFNENPGNDQQFVRKLPEILDEIKIKRKKLSEYRFTVLSSKDKNELLSGGGEVYHECNTWIEAHNSIHGMNKVMKTKNSIKYYESDGTYYLIRKND